MDSTIILLEPSTLIVIPSGTGNSTGFEYPTFKVSVLPDILTLYPTPSTMRVS